MKATIFLFALSVSLILNSCSQVDQEISPASPQLDKAIVTSHSNLPYDYLSVFPELNSKWQPTKESEVKVSLVNVPRTLSHLFLEVEYEGIQKTGNADRELFFIGKVTDESFYFSLRQGKIAANIKVYATNNYKPVKQAPAQLPYPLMQCFSTIPVKEWVTKGNIISVAAGSSANACEQIFMSIVSKEGNMLVFLADPPSEYLDIPKYGNLAIEKLQLYGLSYSRTFDAK